MKKILAIMCTAILVVSMFASTAMADSIAPVYWDLEIAARKADPADVIKDGKIGENEYDKLDFDAHKLWINHHANMNENNAYENLLEKIMVIMDSAEYYFSWDETNGLNFAVRYIPVDFYSDTTQADVDGNGEAAFFTQTGALMMQFCAALSKGEENFVNVLYTMIGTNDNGDFLTFTYGNQSGYPYNAEKKEYSGGYKAENGKNAVVVYDESTGYITYEVSVPVAMIKGEDGRINMVLSIFSGGTKNSWAETDHFSLALGQWGFFMGQTQCTGGKLTAVTLVDEEVGYVPPVQTVEPTEEPTTTVENDGMDVWMIVAIVAIVLAIAGWVVALLKKKK